MNLNFKKPLLNLEGKEEKDQQENVFMLNIELAKWLGRSNPKEVDKIMKHWNWSQALYGTGHLEIDGPDSKYLKEFIEKNDRLNVYDQSIINSAIKAQMIDVIEKAEKKEK